MLHRPVTEVIDLASTLRCPPCEDRGSRAGFESPPSSTGATSSLTDTESPAITSKYPKLQTCHRDPYPNGHRLRPLALLSVYIKPAPRRLSAASLLHHHLPNPLDQSKSSTTYIHKRQVICKRSNEAEAAAMGDGRPPPPPPPKPRPPKPPMP